MHSKSTSRKTAYILLGILFLVLTYAGILFPGLPAVPFLLLAAFFFTNSSERMYKWMTRQKFIGRLLERVIARRGHLGYMLFMISHIWMSVILALILFHNKDAIVISAFACGIALSYAIFFTLR